MNNFSHFRNTKKIPRWIGIKEAEKMFSVCDSTRNRMMMKLMFYCGLRCSEVLNLRKTDVSLEEKYIFIRNSKGDKDRIVPIPKLLLKELTEYLKEIDDKLFYMTGRHLRRLVKEYAIKSQIPKAEEIHPHTLRHSYATYLKNKGVPITDIKHVLGHSNISTTMIYLHMSDERMRSVVDKAFKGKV